MSQLPIDICLEKGFTDSDDLSFIKVDYNTPLSQNRNVLRGRRIKSNQSNLRQRSSSTKSCLKIPGET